MAKALTISFGFIKEPLLLLSQKLVMASLFFYNPLSLLLLLRLLALLATQRILCQFPIVSDREQMVGLIAAKDYIFTIQSSHNPQIRCVGYVRALIEIVTALGAPTIVLKSLNFLVGVIIG